MLHFNIALHHLFALDSRIVSLPASAFHLRTRETFGVCGFSLWNFIFLAARLFADGRPCVGASSVLLSFAFLILDLGAEGGAWRILWLRMSPAAFWVPFLTGTQSRDPPPPKASLSDKLLIIFHIPSVALFKGLFSVFLISTGGGYLAAWIFPLRENGLNGPPVFVTMKHPT